MLLASWQRRKLWEADAQALAVVKWLAEAVGGKSSAGNGRRGHSQAAGRQRVSGAAMMAMAGGELAGD